MEQLCDGVINLVSQLAALDAQTLTPHSTGSHEQPIPIGLASPRDHEPPVDADAPPGAWGKLTSQDVSVCASCYLTMPPGKEFLAGRSTQCNVVVRDAFVSSIQFAIYRKATGAGLKDTAFILADKSVNGTFVNVRSVGMGRQRTLHAGDLINFRLSNSRFFLGFRFEVLDHGQKAPRAPGNAKKDAKDDLHRHNKSKTETSIEWKIGEEMLGKGGNAEVFLGINLTNGKLIAVKRVALPRDAHSRRQFDSLLDEIGVLSKASHPHIVQYYGASQSSTHLHILLEFVPGGSIQHLLKNFGPLGDQLIVRYLRQVVQGLRYLHGESLIHGDLKTANVLVTDKGVVKITDFGTAKVVKETHVEFSDGSPTTVHGTLLWMAPEVVRGTHVPSASSDIWSVGCCIIEMLSASHPWAEYDFDNEEEMANLLRYCDEPPEIPPTNSAVLHTVAHACLNLDPEQRPTAAQLLEMLSEATSEKHEVGDAAALVAEASKARAHMSVD
jgi:hypothetical protein